MTPMAFTATRVRQAATCPRVFYFDTRGGGQTLLWKRGDPQDGVALGSLFHHTMSRFNQGAAADGEVQRLLRQTTEVDALKEGLVRRIYHHYLDHDKLVAATGHQQQNFMAALACYVGEVADLLHHGRRAGLDQDKNLGFLFGDHHRGMRVTFPVGPGGESVQISGVMDYYFRDWRRERHRVIDYKLTPSGHPSQDLFQVCLYALMDHRQHGGEADAAVFYLHPARALVERSWEEIWGERHKIFDLLASMVAWSGFDETTGSGLRPPGETGWCGVCKWNRLQECERRLGAKESGARHHHWADGWTSQQPPVAGTTSVNGLSGALLNIGHLPASGQPLTIPVAVLPTHVAVVGAAGSGKSWLAKVLAEEAVLAGVPVLAIDPQGDLVQFLRPRQPAVGVDYQRYWQQVTPRIYTPGSSHATRLALSPLRLGRQEEILPRHGVARRQEEWHGMVAAAAANLVALADARGETKAQESFLFELLNGLSRGEGQEIGMALVVAAILDPALAGIDNPDALVRKSEREKLGRMLTAILRGSASNLFTGGEPLDLDRMSQGEAGRVPLTVIYLNAMVNDGQKQYFVAALANEIYRWMVTTPATTGHKPRLLFYLDEARDYLPAGAASPPAKEPLKRLFQQGRKFGVSCLICTQSPRSVDYNVFGNSSTKLIGRLESAQDVDRVREWFGKDGAVPPWLAERRGAAAGTFIGRWPGMAPDHAGAVWQSRALYSMHEGAWGPERLEEELSSERQRARSL